MIIDELKIPLDDTLVRKIIQYLSKKGWELYKQKRNDIVIYQLETESDFFQVTIPVDRNLFDYKQALNICLLRIANSESRTTIELICDILKGE